MNTLKAVALGAAIGVAAGACIGLVLVLTMMVFHLSTVSTLP